MTSPWPNPPSLPNPPRTHPALTLAADRARYRRPATTPNRPELSADEVRLLQLIADGLTRRQVGRIVGCSEQAAARRLERIYRRLGVNNAPHAVAYTIRAGLLPAPDRKASR